MKLVFSKGKISVVEYEPNKPYKKWWELFTNGVNDWSNSKTYHSKSGAVNAAKKLALKESCNE